MKKNRDGWTDRLSEYLDDELAADERRALEEHLARCSECRDTLAQLRGVRERAGSLGERMPEHDLWPGIAARIAAAPPLRVTVSDGTGDVRPAWKKRRFAFSAPQLAAAALVVALLGGGSAIVLSRLAPGARLRAGPEASATPKAAAPVAASFAALDRGTSDAEVDRAVADLEAVLKKRTDHLDPATRQVVSRNLATIDSALVQIRQALRKQPTDAYLNRSLTSTMLRKLDVLRVAVRLAGAAT